MQNFRAHAPHCITSSAPHPSRICCASLGNGEQAVEAALKGEQFGQFGGPGHEHREEEQRLVAEHLVPRRKHVEEGADAQRLALHRLGVVKVREKVSRARIWFGVG